jgi:tetratricopeptide (TPR) repeat protein
LQPRDPDPYFRIAVIYSKEGRWNEAAGWYRHALARDPRHFLSHMNLARVAERVGDAAEAMRHYQAVLSTAPNEPSDDSLRAQALVALRRLAAPVPEERVRGERR